MRITKVSVKKLFGVFDHEIPLKDSRITIIHGPNGFGKTVLLTMIHGLFNSKYKIFSDIPFEEFRIEFEDDEGIYIQPFLEDDDQERDDTSTPYAIRPYQAVDEPPYVFIIRHLQGGEVVDEPSYVSDVQASEFRREVDSIPELDRIGSNRWLNVHTGSILTMEGAIETYNLGSKLYSKSDPKWFKQIKKKISTTFIQAQRLQSQMIPDPSRSFYRRREALAAIGPAVEEYSSEIVKKIRTTSDVYEKQSQVKERSFPGRVIGGSSYPKFRDLYERLAELESKRKDFMELGLLDVDKNTPDIPQLSSEQENTGRDLEDLAEKFFSTYVQDIEDKLSEFDEISKQLRLLKEIINNRFQHKQFTINKQGGFIILSSDNDSIPIASLSSGEQHELVLFYRLLFHVQPNSLILIDEPELSLHVDWQRNFLNDIQRITELRDFDVLMATHSPMIIQDKWDWMVGLDEPEKDS